MSTGGSNISQGRGRQPQGGGSNLLFGEKFPEMYKNEKNLDPEGARVPGAPLPLRSANGCVHECIFAMTLLQTTEG